jgi:hypothetical protein
MTNERFFRGFLAALKLQGESEIVTKDDAHHQTLDAVVEVLDEARRTHRSGAEEMPATLIPQEITGRYHDWDSALVALQRGKLLTGRNPTYPCVEILFNEDEARRLLERYTPEQREIFNDLATAYRQRPAVR